MSLVYHSSRLCFCRSWILLSWNSLPIGGTEGALQRQTHDPARESWESSNYTSVSIYFLNKKLVFYFLPSLVLKGLKHDPRRTKWIENILVNVSGQEPSLYFNLRLQFMSVFFFLLLCTQIWFLWRVLEEIWKCKRVETFHGPLWLPTSYSTYRESGLSFSYKLQCVLSAFHL